MSSVGRRLPIQGSGPCCAFFATAAASAFSAASCFGRLLPRISRTVLPTSTSARPGDIEECSARSARGMSGVRRKEYSPYAPLGSVIL